MIYRIRHITEYQYSSAVSLCYNKAHILPRDTDYQVCRSRSIKVLPSPTYSQRRQDYFGNDTYYFTLEKPHTKLTIEVVSEIETRPVRSSLNLDIGLTCKQARDLLTQSNHQEIIEAREFILDSPMIKVTPQLKAFAEPLFKPNTPLLSAVRALTSAIYKEFKYDPNFTTLATPLQDVLAHKRGVCQDFAHLAIGCLRALGFPARYISGYLETLPPPGQEKLVGADASHAWFAVFSPTEGWFEFDPTNDNMPSTQHITTAWGRDYSDVTPVKGVIFEGGGKQAMNVSVDVQRIAD